MDGSISAWRVGHSGDVDYYYYADYVYDNSYGIWRKNVLPNISKNIGG